MIKYILQLRLKTLSNPCLTSNESIIYKIKTLKSIIFNFNIFINIYIMLLFIFHFRHHLSVQYNI